MSASAAVPMPSVDDSPAMRALPFVLAFTAGSVDVIGFLGLGGLFTAHITGNLVILAAHVVARGDAPLPLVLSVPVFIASLVIARVLAAALERAGHAPLAFLLLVQLLLLAGFLALAVTAAPGASSTAPPLFVASMLGVCAMAVQNELVRVGMADAPATAVLTTNITLLTTDVGEILMGTDSARAARARVRAMHTAPVVIGFLVGCALGAACEAALGLRALWLPFAAALVSLALGLCASERPGRPG